jgi:hypothetical protein
MVARYVSDDPREQDYVQSVLQQYPHLGPFIEEVTALARESFPEVNVHLGPQRYEDDDPLLHLMIEVTQAWEDYRHAARKFVHAVVGHPSYDPDLLLVMPTWVGERSLVSR